MVVRVGSFAAASPSPFEAVFMLAISFVGDNDLDCSCFEGDEARTEASVGVLGSSMYGDGSEALSSRCAASVTLVFDDTLASSLSPDPLFPS